MARWKCRLMNRRSKLCILTSFQVLQHNQNLDKILFLTVDVIQGFFLYSLNRKSDWVGGDLSSLFKRVSVAQRSTRQARLLVSCRVNIEHLSVQYWPNLLWGWFKKTLHVTIAFITKKITKKKPCNYFLFRKKHNELVYSRWIET